ncbi:MAG: hypothetical protein JWO94_3166 [Verrucomicrobiaceae bacterium]|nr:hypothetical protein [Verrucomicrobiaceae bacterium]
MRIRVPAIVITSVALAGAWWAGGRATTNPAAAGMTASGAGQAVKGPDQSLPAGEGRTEAASPLLQGILHGDVREPDLAQLQTYLRENNRNAESLLTASRLTHDLGLLREAARRFPDDPQIHLELALRSDNAAEKHQAITGLCQLDPGNALGPYLAADEAFAAADSKAAVRSLMEAAQRPALNDYSRGAEQSAEEAYLAAGYPPVEAQAAAVFGRSQEQAERLSELGGQMSLLMKSCVSAGDTVAAQTMASLGQSLGQRMQGSLGHSVAGELAGTAIEGQFLNGQDAAAVLNEEGLTVQQRLDQLAARKDYIKTTVRGADPTSPDVSPQILAQYLGRAKVQGEMPALQWLRARLNLPLP